MLFPLYDDNPTRRWPLVTVFLILFNAVIHLVITQMPQGEQGEFYAKWGFVPQRIEQLSDPNLVVKVDVRAGDDLNGDLNDDLNGGINGGLQPRVKQIALKADSSQIVATLFTTMFLHGGWLHLLSNVWMLWIFGNNIEDRLGHVIFVLFYVVAGLLATACHWVSDPASAVPVVGASGAIAGVLGAYAITFPKAKVKTIVFLGFIFFPVNLPALIVLGVWFIMEFVQFQFQHLNPNIGGVAFAAHVGGFIAGLLIMPLMAMGAPDPGTHWEDELDDAFGLNE